MIHRSLRLFPAGILAVIVAAAWFHASPCAATTAAAWAGEDDDREDRTTPPRRSDDDAEESRESPDHHKPHPKPPRPDEDDDDEPDEDSLAKELSGGRVGKFIERFTYVAIIGVLLLCGMGLPLPEEVPILTSGILASTGHLRPWPALTAVMVGVMAGDSMMFLLGKRWGSQVFEHKLSRKLLTRERQLKIMDYFAKYGAWIIFAARFLPGLRAPLFLTAGTMKVPFWLFFAMDGAAALLSIPISFYVAYYFTDKLTEMLHASHRIMYWAIGAVLVFSLGSHWFWSWLKRRRQARVQAAVGAPAPVDPPEGDAQDLTPKA